MTLRKYVREELRTARRTSGNLHAGKAYAGVNPEELKLLRRLQAGDDHAWNEWFDTVAPRVWRYLARLIGADRDGVADAVQEVFLGAVRGLAEFNPATGSLTPWLLGIAHRQAALYWRKRKRTLRMAPDLTITQVETSLTARVINPDQAELSESIHAVRLTLSELPEDAAQVLIGRYLEQKPTAELAIEFGITEDAVRSRLLRARERFRTAFRSLHRELV